MSASDTAKDVIRIATTAGLSKDVIDLMDRKLALLTSENAELKTQITVFKAQVENLQAQLDAVRAEIKRRDEADDNPGIYEAKGRP